MSGFGWSMDSAGLAAGPSLDWLREKSFGNWMLTVENSVEDSESPSREVHELVPPYDSILDRIARSIEIHP